MLRIFLLSSLLVTVGLAAVSPARAGKVQVWNHHATGDYDKAQFKQTVVSSEGVLRLSRRLRPLAGLDVAHVWDIVEDAHGNLFVATGDEGKIYKIDPEGKATVAYAGAETEMLCLALADDGSIYAGTGPQAHIVRIKPDGTTGLFCKMPALYVWSLAMDRGSGTLYAGTGPRGRVYQIRPTGEVSVFYQTRQAHILALALAGDGMLYAGTDKNGLVYRIDPRGKGFVLYSAPQAEIRSLLVTPNGVYAGTCSPGRQRLVSGTSERSGDSGGVVGRTVSLTKTEGDNTTVSTPRRRHLSETHSGEGDRSGTSPSAAAPAIGENSLYRIGYDGSVREVFREKALVLSLLRQDGRIYIGTGMHGQLFEVNEATKERSQIARLENGQIHCLYRRHDGAIIVGTGDPGKLYVLQDRYAQSGTILSDVLDAKMISKWGTLQWRASTPEGTALSIAARSGNVAEPDETWSDWSEEQTNPATATVSAPSARFLQYRVTLRTDDPTRTPALNTLTVRYMTTNQAPEVARIEVPDLDTGVLDNPKKLKLHWSASDPNDDELTYTLYARKDGWKSWVKLADDLEKKEYEWDTTTTPSGTYRIKVVASDRKDNPAEDALSGGRVSAPFVVAHQPPTVSLKVLAMDGDQAIIEAQATDPLVRLTSASFAVNSKKWVNVFPSNGLFDRKTARFRFKTASLNPGAYVLVLRVTDAAGNTGSGDVVFTVKSN